MDEILRTAEQISRAAHLGQYRKDGRPYMAHVEAVVAQVGDDLEAQALAWLHDVLEDTSYRREELIELGIPERLVQLLDLLTKRREESYVQYIERVKRSDVAIKVKKADIIANLSDRPGNQQMVKLSKALIQLCDGGRRL